MVYITSTRETILYYFESALLPKKHTHGIYGVVGIWSIYGIYSTHGTHDAYDTQDALVSPYDLRTFPYKYACFFKCRNTIFLYIESQRTLRKLVASSF